MSWLSDFIQCFVSILSFILGLWIPDVDQVQVGNLTEHVCAEARWDGDPVYRNGKFIGDVEVVCRFKLSESGDLIELRHILREKVSKDSLAIHDESVLNYRGMPGVRFDHTMDMSTMNRVNEVQGYTHIATDGFTQLVSVFKAAPTQSNRAIYGSQYIALEANVLRVSEDNEYSLTMKSRVYMPKPWLMNPSIFIAEVRRQSEEKMEERANDLTLWIASSL